MTPRVARITNWRCPQCGKTDQTREARVHSRFHPCPRLRGMVTPMVEAGVKAEIVLHERQDYVGAERVRLDPERRRPVMSMETRYADGHTDLRVYAPLAVGDAR